MCMGHQLSIPLPVLSGVPQGIGPLFFSIFFSDICFPSPIFLILNVSMHRRCSSPTSTQQLMHLNQELNIIYSWLSLKSLHINTRKSKYMVFSLRPSQSFFDHLPSITIAGSALERAHSFKYLGVILKPNLSWSDHISSIRAKAISEFLD